MGALESANVDPSELFRGGGLIPIRASWHARPRLRDNLVSFAGARRHTLVRTPVRSARADDRSRLHTEVSTRASQNRNRAERWPARPLPRARIACPVRASPKTTCSTSDPASRLPSRARVADPRLPPSPRFPIVSAHSTPLFPRHPRPRADGMDAVAEGREDDVESDYGSEDDSIIIKLLIPGPAAGSIIGKGGSTINEFQIQTGARIQLSRNNETFPGTTDRLVTLGGTAQAILGAMHLMISKLIADGEGIVDGNPQVKVVIPNVSCGCIIGKGGATIRSFTEDSGADIKLSSQDRMLPGVTDRVLTVTGPIDTVLRAVALVATALMDDDSYASLAARPSTYATHVNLPVGGIARSSFDDARRRQEGKRRRRGARLHHRRRAGRTHRRGAGEGRPDHLRDPGGERSADQGERSRGFRRGNPES